MTCSPDPVRPFVVMALAISRGIRLALALAPIAVLLCACASLPPLRASPPSHAVDDVASTSLAQIAAANAPPAPDGLSGFRLLPEGPFSLNARIALARRAEKSLDVQYYQLQSDAVGLRLLRELRDAASRGVRVRLIVDDLYTAGEDELFASLAAFPNVQVRLFNPLPAREGSFANRFIASLHEFGRINHRMHNKLFIADNVFSVSGGRNMGDEYFMQSAKENFVDADVLSNGPVVRDQSAAFDLYWNSPQVYPVEQIARLSTTPAEARQRFDDRLRDLGPDIPTHERDVLGRTSVERQLAEGRLEQFRARASVLVDSPAKIDGKTSDERFAGSVTARVIEMFDTAQTKLLMISPYFVPGRRGMPHLEAMARRGVKMTVLTNSLGATDEPLVYLGYARYRADMLRLGMDLYEISPKLGYRTRLGEFGTSIARLHAKLAVIDEDRIFIGSMNLDGRSSRLNTEIGLVIESPEVVRDFRRLLPPTGFESAYRLRLDSNGAVEWLEHDDSGQLVVHHDNPDTSWFVQLKNWLSSLFVDEDQL